jgi:cytosine/uracil/thiamine/allantoin permease
MMPKLKTTLKTVAAAAAFLAATTPVHSSAFFPRAQPVHAYSSNWSVVCRVNTANGYFSCGTINAGDYYQFYDLPSGGPWLALYLYDYAQGRFVDLIYTRNI